MKIDASPGDYVELKTEDGDYSGVLMPRPELAKKDHIILKLDSGYNVGVNTGKIKKLTKKKKSSKTKFPKAKKVKKNPDLPDISILGCGGTIASKVDYETGGVKWAMSPEEIMYGVPEITDIANVKEAKLLFNVASENMDSAHWKKMAKEVASALNSGSRGVILMHGTDTMHYSSAALSFMLKDLSGPVIFTGAQRSSDRGSSDAFMNLICSAQIAAKSDLGEVTLCMHGTSNDDYCLAHRGTRVRKMHTSARDTFQSINASPLLQVFPSGEMEKLSDYEKAKEGKVKVEAKFEDKVALIKSYPGASPEIIDFYADKGYKGLVVEATGLGHAPLSWLPSIKTAIEKGVRVVFAPQTLYGSLDPYVYEPARKFLAAGVEYACDSLPEVAFVRLAWELG